MGDEVLDRPYKAVSYTVREIQEIEHCLFYAKRWHHGTVGHNLLMLVAKMAMSDGFALDKDILYIPPGVEIVKE